MILGASETTLLNIEKDYQNQIDVVQEEAEQKRQAKQQEIDQAKNEFEQIKLQGESDVFQARLDSQLEKLDEFFTEKKQMLLEAGYSEEAIAKAHDDAIKKLEADSARMRLKNQGKALGQMASNIAEFGAVGFALSKALNIAQVVMETPAAAMAAYKAVVGIPIVGPSLAPIAFGAVVAQGAMSIGQIMKAKPPKAETGGLSGRIFGASHNNGGVLIEAEGDEYITNKKRVKELGVGFFDFLNFAPLESVKKMFSGMESLSLPAIPSLPMPSTVMATGGQINNQYSLGNSISFGELIDEIKSLREDVKAQKLVVNNYISADDVINNADPALLNERNEEGGMINSKWD